MRATLLRHAEKKSALNGQCGGLTLFGHEQAKNFANAIVESRKAPQLKATHIYTSPKLRAQETVAPLARTFSLDVIVRPDLTEQLCHETTSEFLSRIRNFLKFIFEEHPQNASIYLCSHMDWLQEALCLIPSSDPRTEDVTHFSPCQSISFEIDSTGLWHPDFSH